MAEESIPVKMMPGASLPPEARSWLADHPGEAYRDGERIYASVGDLCLTFPEGPEGEQLIAALTESRRERAETTTEGLLRNWMERKETPGLRTDIGKLNLPFRPLRCVAVFLARGRWNGSFADLFRAVAPLEADDCLVAMRPDTVAMIKTVSSAEGEEAMEYAEAAVESLEVEAGISTLCGIGESKAGWEFLADSYDEARSALRLAEVFHRPGAVFRFRDQALERLLEAIPPEVRNRVRSDYFGTSGELTGDREMIETVRCFFENDLSLSMTSRQLFVHRNTLLYRLEKIRRMTGLDLRKFPDACLFRILLNLPE